jgi:hypothetical protein
MTMTATERQRLAARQGMLAAGLDAGLEVLYRSARAIDLLDGEDRKRFNTAMDLLRGISQRAWSKL